MSVTKLIARLAQADPSRRGAAVEALVEAGGAAVPPLVAVLLDEGSPVDWSAAGVVLRRIGEPAFAPLVEAIATAPDRETRRRCGWAFVGFGPDLVGHYAGALAHPSPHVRAQAALGIQYRRKDGLPALPALLPLLADPVEEVRQRALWALAELGTGALPALQKIRAEGPGRLRAGALTAIADVAGERAFTPADRAAVERLVRVKLAGERPETITGCEPCGPWLALPTGDQAAVLAALDLSDPRPATLRLGFAAVASDSHGGAGGPQRHGRVFVTPRLDGWTLVLGAWYARWGPASREVDAGRELSGRFGTARSFWYDAQTGSSSWLLCDRGEVVRRYDEEQPRRSVGDRLPVEQGRLLPHEGPDIPEAELDAWDPYAPDSGQRWQELCRRYDVPETCDALTVAAATSVSPADLGPHTELRGHGGLALTRHGRRFGVPRGALPV
ncbi:HEAT repeat domain-containing protein [Micromonospora sagamiensis]|uniref:HEAT repeat domain-containing protein n=1 Tax=Micromonospora sagamiensis TaxID=47875 RepID=UPI0011A2DE2C|nr:HEAT repeat domain-containing protein [Micromonospora sagamiensis]